MPRNGAANELTVLQTAVYNFRGAKEIIKKNNNNKKKLPGVTKSPKLDLTTNSNLTF